MTNGEMLQEYQMDRAVSFQGRSCKIISLDFRAIKNAQVMMFTLASFCTSPLLEEVTADECELMSEALAA